MTEYYQCLQCEETFSIEEEWIDGEERIDPEHGNITMTYNISEIETFINHIKKCQFRKVKDPYGD